METSILNPPILAIIAAGGLVFFLFTFIKMVNDPKIGIYLVIITAPFTASLGNHPLMQRVTISEITGVLFLSTWFLNRIFVSDRSRVPFTSFTAVAWSLVFVCLLSVCVNLVAHTRPFQAVIELMILLYLLVFYTLFEKLVSTDKDIRYVINVWLAIAAVVVIIGLWDMGTKFWGWPSFMNLSGDQYEWRVSGTFRRTGQLGVYLLSAFWIVLAAYFLPDTSKWYRFALLLLMLGIIIVSLAASRRSAFAGFLVGAAVFMFINLKRIKRLALWAGLILCIVLVIVGLLSINKGFAHYFSYRIAVLHPAAILEKDTIKAQRKTVTQAFVENPVLGIGFGGFQGSKYDSTGHEIHSAPGQILAETGIIGILVYVLFLGMLLKLAYQNAFKLNDAKWSQFSTVIFAALFGLYTSALYNRHLRERSFWVLVGIIVCINRLAKWRSQQKLARQYN